MYSKIVAGSIIFSLFSCTGGLSHQNEPAMIRLNGPEPAGLTDIASIPLPEGFKRTNEAARSFGAWLRELPLKKDPTVYLYNGSVKPNQDAQFAVIDISVGNKDLQQCADAVMRLRAEYLYSLQQYDKISFTDNEGTVYRFDRPFTRERFNNYLLKVFGMCGTASLSKQLKPVDMMHMQPGNVLIKGGFPGHAVIVMDMAQNTAGEKIYLLAQSYMPAQDVHILKNPSKDDMSPWYRLNNDVDIITPEYHFTNDQLKGW